MDELNQFEARFAERLRAYSAPAARRPDPTTVARALESRKEAELRRSWWMKLGRGPRMFVLVGAALLAIGGGALVAGSLVEREGRVPPVPTPSPTLPGPTPTSAAESCLGIDPAVLDRSRAPMAGPRPAGPSSPGPIALSGIRDNVDVHLLDPLSGSVVRITDLQPALSPNALTAQIEWSALAWSPDGRALAFDVMDVRPRSGQSDCAAVFVVSADGARLRRLVSAIPGAQVAGSSPTWVPDGSAVLLQAPVGLGTVQYVSLDGSPVADLGGPADCGVHAPAYWSPDGSLLAMLCIHRDPNRPLATQDPPTGVAVRGLEGDWRVVASGDFGRVQGWLPDGSILVLSNLPGPENYSLVAVAADASGEPRTLPSFESIEGVPVLSPDGTRVAVEAARNLDIVDLATGKRVNVLSGAGRLGGAVWSPDGLQIAYRLWPDSEPLSNVSIWTVRADGSGARELLTGDFGGPMAWQPLWP